MDESLLHGYLEKRGLKYVVPLSALSYILGTLIFNTYFYNLGISEFDLIKLRYMLVGVMFVVLTGGFLGLLYSLKKLVTRNRSEENQDRATKKFRIIEISLLVLFLPWVVVYALYLFPLLPSAFGGAKPEFVRLIGEEETMRQLNEMIAFETGIDPTTLPLEKLNENSNLAAGANVKVLDRNSERVVLVLTKDIYLSTTSSVAKKLLDSGTVKTFNDDDYASDFKTKPIIFSADNIRGTTTTLYQPSNVTTKADIEIVTQVLTEEPEKAAKVQAAITEDLKEVAPKLVQAVQKKVAQKKSAPATTQTRAEKVEEVLEGLEIEAFDTKFISFRGELFQFINLAYLQQKTGDRSLVSRQRVAKKFAETFESTYPVVWVKFSGNGNFLITGQGNDEYFLRLQRIVQGATTAEMIMERLNEETIVVGPVFDDIKAGLLDLLDKSSAQNTVTNRKYISEVVQRYLRQKSPQMKIYWLDNRFLVDGITSEKFLEELKLSFVEAESWEKLATKMEAALIRLKAVQVETEKLVEETNESEVIVEDDSKTDEVETEAAEKNTESDETDGVSDTNSTEASDVEPVTEESATEVEYTDAEKKSAPGEEPARDETVVEQSPGSETPAEKESTTEDAPADAQPKTDQSNTQNTPEAENSAAVE